LSGGGNGNRAGMTMPSDPTVPDPERPVLPDEPPSEPVPDPERPLPDPEPEPEPALATSTTSR
jgi:hypothetical protein